MCCLRPVRHASPSPACSTACSAACSARRTPTCWFILPTAVWAETVLAQAGAVFRGGRQGRGIPASVAAGVTSTACLAAPDWHLQWRARLAPADLQRRGARGQPLTPSLSHPPGLSTARGVANPLTPFGRRERAHCSLFLHALPPCRLAIATASFIRHSAYALQGSNAPLGVLHVVLAPRMTWRAGCDPPASRSCSALRAADRSRCSQSSRTTCSFTVAAARRPRLHYAPLRKCPTCLRGAIDLPAKY